MITSNTRLLTAFRVAAFAVLFTPAAVALASPEIPGAPQNHPIALVGAKVFPQTGPPIENATVLFDKGKIVNIGVDIALPDKTEKIEVRGLQVHPGLIDANTQLGLVEMPSIRASVDTSETGSINPNVRAETAFNPDSELIPVARSTGVLTVLTVPDGGLMTGRSCAMHLDGWTWEDMCLGSHVGLHIRWPAVTQAEGGRGGTEGPRAETGSDRAQRSLRDAFDDARAYNQSLSASKNGSGVPAPEFNARWEAMADVITGKMKVFIHAEDVQQIQAALAFAEQQKIKPVIVGGYDAQRCAALLKKNDVPVVIGGVHRLPRRRNEAYDTPFTLPERLRQAGVKYCIASPTGGPASNVRNLSHHAGTAVAYGLPVDEAQKAITLYPAQILGVADRIGSLETGKDATLIVTTGDPLEITSEVKFAYIQGRAVSLNDRHTRLWEKYKEKYRRIGIEN